MPINFIPNDPLAGAVAPPVRQQNPRPNRPANRSGFTFHDPEPEAVQPPGTPKFLFWQCREAALAAVETWESHAGPLRRWALNRRRLDVFQNAVAQLGDQPQPNAFYDRASIQLFEFTGGGKTTFSGESTDVVAHEVGHGLLDAIRPDLWDTPFLEVSAFHEAFGDCIALLTGLADAQTRQALLAANIGAQNFLETTAEDLSDAIRRVWPQHNAAAPRRAFNNIQWQLPSTLPDNGPPGALINESHSFSQVFTGCFYDVIRNILGTSSTDATLQTAVRTATQLLLAGARSAPETTRFFQAVGRAMTLADQQLNNGANRTAIHNTFARHGIALGSNAMLAPVAALAGTGPKVTARGATLSSVTHSDLAGRLGARARTRMLVRPLEIAGERVAQAVHLREVQLGSLNPRLKGVVALAPESVLVGSSGARAAVLGALPQPSTTRDEVMSFVESLVKRNQIRFDQAKAAARKTELPFAETHAVKVQKGKKVLARLRFACGCG